MENSGKIHAKLGFDENPFIHTNADREDKLQQYFVRPPYFDSVFGDPKTPQSFVVFAPRGGGKTTQRLMIEKECIGHNVLAVTYDRFEFPDIRKIEDITLRHHLQKIIQSLLWATFVSIHQEPMLARRLSKLDRQNLVNLSNRHLRNINEAIVDQTTHSLKSIAEKVKIFWNEFFPFIKPGAMTILENLIGKEVEISDTFGEMERPQRSDVYFKNDLRVITKIIQTLGYASSYILVDRVDELDETSRNPEAAFALVKPLLQDLELLETQGLGFKFFLWDQLEPLYKKVVRTDRIQHEILEWEQDMMREMWMKRLRTFSHRRISYLSQVADELAKSIDELILIFANHSPRDAIRLGAQVLAEQQEVESTATKISRIAIMRGIEKFCSTRSHELIDDNSTLRELRKIRKVDFTIPYLSNDVFHEKQAATRSRIIKWINNAVIVQVNHNEDAESKQYSRATLFAIEDPRIAKLVCSEIGVLEFVDTKYRTCPVCNTFVLRDWDEADTLPICHICQYDWTVNEDDQYAIWKFAKRAAERKAIRREEKLVAYQLSFADHLLSSRSQRLHTSQLESGEANYDDD